MVNNLINQFIDFIAVIGGYAAGAFTLFVWWMAIKANGYRLFLNSKGFLHNLFIFALAAGSTLGVANLTVFLIKLLRI